MPVLDIYMDFGALHVPPTHPHNTIKKYGVCIKYSLNFHESIPKETVSCPCSHFFSPEFSCVSGKKELFWFQPHSDILASYLFQNVLA